MEKDGEEGESEGEMEEEGESEGEMEEEGEKETEEAATDSPEGEEEEEDDSPEGEEEEEDDEKEEVVDPQLREDVTKALGRMAVQSDDEVSRFRPVNR